METGRFGRPVPARGWRPNEANPNQVNLKAGLESAHGSSVSVRSYWFASGEGVTDPALLR